MRAKLVFELPISAANLCVVVGIESAAAVATGPHTLNDIPKPPMIKTAGLVGFAGPAESPIVPWRSGVAFWSLRATGRYEREDPKQSAFKIQRDRLESQKVAAGQKIFGSATEVTSGKE